MATINKNPKKCSAVSTMERSMPDFDYSHLVKELRGLIIADIDQNPDKYSKNDIQEAYDNDWFIARYLLRNNLDVKNAHQMLRKALEFRNTPIMSIEEFPAEFYKIGAIFTYEPDRKGNIPVYMRVRLNQKISVLQPFLKAFLFRTIEEADKKAKGKGIALVFDLQGAGISNVDMDLLYFVLSSLVNYFPKGLSYMLVHELPWILRSAWRIAKQWLSDDHRDLVKFSDSQTIYEYIKEENLPDFIGGTCEKSYRIAPSNCITIEQAVKRWDVDLKDAYRIKERFAAHLPQEDE